jgi:hypothetical protein
LVSHNTLNPVEETGSPQPTVDRKTYEQDYSWVTRYNWINYTLISSKISLINLKRIHPVPAKQSHQALGETAFSSSNHDRKIFRFQSRKNIFLLLLPLILLVGGVKVDTSMAANLWRGFNFKDLLQQAPDLALLKSFLTRFIPGSSQTDYSLEITSSSASTVDRFGLLELNLKTDIPFTNPYSAKEIDLKVLFTAPSGKRWVVGAFWYQDFDAQTRQPSGKPGWKARFTPAETGQWTAMAIAPTLNLESKPYRFDVVSSKRAGFVRINPSNSHYLATDDGNFFFPIGVNMAWWEEGKDPLAQYRQWLLEFTKNGGNTIRVWMAAWSFGIEWKDSGLGNYDSRMYQAWLLDQLFLLADEYQVKIILVLINHGPLSLTANSEWKDNPYNIAQGGPLESPEQFVTNPEAIATFKQRLSYIINRWGYSPDLLAWEWFNEVDLTPIPDKALVPWLEEMTAYLRQRDINRHLITNSFSIRSWSEAWHLSELDIVQIHEYADKLSPGERDPADTAGMQYQLIDQDLPQKPILLGEFGYSAKDYGEDVEKTGIQLHNGIWATTFSGYAGSGMYWWWDTYIAPNNLWFQFKGLADFIRGEDLTQYQPAASLQILDRQGEAAGVTGMELRGQVTLVWLRSKDYTVEAAIASRKDDPGATTYSASLKEGLFLKVLDLTPGSYSVYWYDPQTATWLGQETVRSETTALTIPMPAFKDDLAAKIVQNP